MTKCALLLLSQVDSHLPLGMRRPWLHPVLQPALECIKQSPPSMLRLRVLGTSHSQELIAQAPVPKTKQMSSSPHPSPLSWPISSATSSSFLALSEGRAQERPRAPGVALGAQPFLFFQDLDSTVLTTQPESKVASFWAASPFSLKGTGRAWPRLLACPHIRRHTFQSWQFCMVVWSFSFPKPQFLSLYHRETNNNTSCPYLPLKQSLKWYRMPHLWAHTVPHASL